MKRNKDISRFQPTAIGGTAFDDSHDVETLGPVYASHKVDGDRVHVRFDHVGKGLAFRHADDVRGFEVSGPDGDWVWASAVIEGDSVVVSSPEVPKPVNVRYAFRADANFANLFNKDGLPALMFTTAEWTP